MSGGVDSSVAAALLKKQGYFVAGAFMKNFSAESWQGVIENGCPWEQDLKDVQAVCEKLGIEFRSFNFEKEYKDKVIEYFFAEYAAGRTPNPDVMCNKEIKFGMFLQKAMELGFDYIATGHYARVLPASSLRSAFGGEANPRRDRHSAAAPRDNITSYELLKGIDPKKDQSYFLYTLNQEQLSRILFPIGGYTKPQVRQMAKEFGLPNWDKKDSQGVCFVGHIKLREFLKQRIPERVGEIVEATTGRVIGEHLGAWYYTVGQREGIGVGGGQPYYVSKKDVVNNLILVEKNSPFPPSLVKEGVGGVQNLYSKRAYINDVHWIGEEPALPRSCKAKIRYQQQDQDCIIHHCEESAATDDEAISNTKKIASHPLAMTENLEITFTKPQFAIAAGQSIVFYDRDRVLGGGILQ